MNIVLTGTIIPNITGGVVSDPARRRDEYLAVIRHCRQFGTVWFLENSTYDLAADPDFAPAPDFHIRQFPPSENPARGKGYQEFEMLDRWITNEPAPPDAWLKITGRYLVKNLRDILAECATSNVPLIIDQLPRARGARTYLFYTTTAAYRARLLGLHAECDDAAGWYIEHAVFRRLRSAATRDVRSFRTVPHITATSGTSGAHITSDGWRLLAKRLLRSANRLFDERYLWWQSHL